MLPTTRRGLSSWSRSTVKPRRSSTPTRKFSSSTSERRTSAASTSASSGSLRSRTIDSLLRFADMKYVESSWWPVDAPAHGGPQARVSSPVALSTLITRAPRSPSIIAACGPARALVRSRTTTSASGPDGVASLMPANLVGARGAVGRGWLGGAMSDGATTYHLVRPGPAAAEPVTLDPEQQRVVDHAGGPLLVLAGPGHRQDHHAGRGDRRPDRATRRRPVAGPGAHLQPQGRRELRDRVTARLGRTTVDPDELDVPLLRLRPGPRLQPGRPLHRAAAAALRSRAGRRAPGAAHRRPPSPSAGPRGCARRSAPGASPARSSRCWPGPASGASTPTDLRELGRREGRARVRGGGPVHGAVPHGPRLPERPRLRRPDRAGAVLLAERAPRRRCAAGSPTSSSTSTRTPTRPRSTCCARSPATAATWSWSVTPTSRSTGSAAPTCAASSTSRPRSPPATASRRR